VSDVARTKGRWSRRLVIGGVALVLIVLAGAATLLLAGHHQSQSKIDDVAARACLYRTDAAGRRYVRRQAAVSGVNYVQTLEAMYHRCPRRGVATVRRRTRRRGARLTRRPPPRTPTTQGSGERDDGEDDGGD